MGVAPELQFRGRDLQDSRRDVLIELNNCLPKRFLCEKRSRQYPIVRAVVPSRDTPVSVVGGREASRKRSATAHHPSKGKGKERAYWMPRAGKRVAKDPSPEGANRRSTSPSLPPPTTQPVIPTTFVFWSPSLACSKLISFVHIFGGSKHSGKLCKT